MAIDFPSNPTEGQTHVIGSTVYAYIGGVWAIVDHEATASPDPVALRSQLANRNLIINGAFDIWQRAASFTGDGYTADRWVVSDGGGAHDVSRLSHNLGAHQSKYCLGYNRHVAAPVENAFLAQRIEGVQTLNGKTATLSFTAVSRDDTDKTIHVDFIQRFGTGGTPSALVDVANQTVTITPTIQRFTLTFDIPSITDKTLGTDGNDYLDLRFIEATDFSTFNLWIDEVQLEEGAVATPFERRHIADELALCQRYYRTISLRPRAQAAGEHYIQWPVGLWPPMRVAPSIVTTVDEGANTTGTGTMTIVAAEGTTSLMIRVRAAGAGDLYWYTTNVLDAEL